MLSRTGICAVGTRGELGLSWRVASSLVLDVESSDAVDDVVVQRSVLFENRVEVLKKCVHVVEVLLVPSVLQGVRHVGWLEWFVSVSMGGGTNQDWFWGGRGWRSGADGPQGPSLGVPSPTPGSRYRPCLLVEAVLA